MEQGAGQLWREECSSAVRNGRRGLPEMKEEKGAGETGLAVLSHCLVPSSAPEDLAETDL